MLDAIAEWWAKVMAVPGANWVVAIFLLLSLLLVAIYVAKSFRDLATGRNEIDTSSHFADFEKLRSEGKLDEEEYKRLKEALRRRQ